MRVALAAAAIGAACIAGPAQAITILVMPSAGQVTVTSAVMRTCPFSSDPCVVTMGAGFPVLRDFTLDVPVLDGTYTFDQPLATGESHGSVRETGSLTFSDGSLLSSSFTFSDASVALFSDHASERMIDGFVSLVPVKIVDTGVVLTPVPEPASWAMMIAGFTLAGMALQRRRVSVPLGSA